VGYEGSIDISDRSPVNSVEELLVSSCSGPGLWEREQKRQEEGGKEERGKVGSERTG